MKIGIGVTTYNRPKHIKLLGEQLRKTRSVDSRDWHITYIAEDDPRKGIAYRKNECLRELKDSDYVFLFDDDTLPIKKGWAEFFIEAHKASGQHHFLYLKETPTIKQLCVHLKPEDPLTPSLPYSINEYNNCGGCFMFLTKEVIEKVGAFDETFGLYGFEHCDFSDRIHMAGLTPMGKYLCPAEPQNISTLWTMIIAYHLINNSTTSPPCPLPRW